MPVMAIRYATLVGRIFAFWALALNVGLALGLARTWGREMVRSGCGDSLLQVEDWTCSSEEPTSWEHAHRRPFQRVSKEEIVRAHHTRVSLTPSMRLLHFYSRPPFSFGFVRLAWCRVLLACLDRGP
ncbi:hypothetical protein EDB80DRAFT_725113 [Ilyonectria destructans]|nr:hypothetical protein EDB80DRAFT_725113 [Ilyonectria destructans]